MNQEHPDRRHCRFTVFIFLLTTGAVVLCALQGIFGYPFRKTIALDAAKFVPVEGFAYSAPLPAQYSPWDAQSTSATLYEDAKVSSLYSQRATSVSRFGKGIFSFPEKRRLLFSASDNSDPRINGRSYRIDVPRRVSKWLRPICFIAWFVAAAIHLVTLPNRREALLVWRRHSGLILGSFVRFVGKWPAVILSLPSIYLLSSYPPLWKDVDALAQLTAPASAVNILHYPPLYCFTGRIPFFVTDLIANSGVDRPLHGIFEQQHPTPGGVYLLVIVQHIALIAALTHVTVSLTSHPFLRCVFALLLASFSSLYTHAHCCGSEALSIPATFVLLAAGAAIVRGFSFSAWIAYGTALLVAIGSRHINLIFAVWLPVTLICVGFATRFGWCYPNTEAFNWARAIGIAVLVGAMAIALNDRITKSMIAAFHDEYRSTLGWTLSDRVQSFLDKLPSAERLQLARDLSAKASDPLVRLAIEAHATTGSFYQGTDQVIAEGLIRSGVPPAKIAVERDRIILAATKSYLMTAHPVLIGTIWEDFVLGFVYADNAKIANVPFYENRYASFDKVKHADAWIHCETLPSLGMEKSIIIFDAACRDPYVILGRAIPLGVLMICTILAGLAARVTNGKLPKMVLVGWSVLASGILLYLTCMLGVFYQDRYTLPLLITIIFALLSSLASFRIWSTGR